MAAANSSSPLLLLFLTLLTVSQSMKIDRLGARSPSPSSPPTGGGRGRNARRPYPQITVMGMVYCDICSNNSFSRHSYFLPGVEVKVDCRFKAAAPSTAEEISFTVNRTTNRNGIYRLEIPAVDGIECARESAVVSMCQATLMSSSSPKCNVPGYKATSDVISIKARKPNLCFYSFDALTFRPSRKSRALCG